MTILVLVLLLSFVMVSVASAGACMRGWIIDVHRHPKLWGTTYHVVIAERANQRVWTCSINYYEYSYLLAYPQYEYWGCSCVQGNR